MINISNLSIHFGGHYLFDNVSLTIRPDDRIGLIGRNGTGKSTLLKIICGKQQPDEGNVSIPKDYSMGYLPQEVATHSDKSVYEETESSLTEIKELEKLLSELSKEISGRTDYESKEYLKLIDKLTETNERFEILGGSRVEAEIEKVLIGLGFCREEFKRPLSEFSGGWQMRVELAKILLRKPDCILLDEPSNHLDIESIQWLEEFLKDYKGSVILVSHDRNFLDAVTKRTIEISMGKIYDFDLPYSKFIIHREEIKRQQKNAYENQQRQIAQTERFIERFRYKATLASRVQSKVKQLEKIERIEIEDEDSSKIKFRFPSAPRCGKVAIETINLSKKYGDKLVLDNINFSIERGEKIAFVGKNGEGKTTLSRILANDISDYSGEIKHGTNLMLGYYAQHQAEMLDADARVFDIIERAARGEMRTQVRTLLGAFLFSGDSVYKKVKVLSGGEKSRLAVARLLLQESNLLILDEPTNHLDMLAKDVLKNALLNYDGALILVSHDRNFLHGLTERTVYFSKKNISEYTGDIYEFIQRHKIESLKELEISCKENNFRNTKAGKSLTQLDREEKKGMQREKNRIMKQIEQKESEIEKLEKLIQEQEKLFTEPDFMNNIETSKAKQKKYETLRKELNINMDEWTKLNNELEGLT
jgi:ATP-binding cassette, subfamily F, member 3